MSCPVRALVQNPAGNSITRYPISKSELQKALSEIEPLLLNESSWLEAKTKYETLLQYDLSLEDRAAIQNSLESINMKIFFSPIPTQNSFFYEAKKGDSLFEIAKKYHTTIELIQKANRLNKDLIRPDMKLKITKAKLRIEVDKSENKLHLFASNELLKTYSVATGKNNSTP